MKVLKKSLNEDGRALLNKAIQNIGDVDYGSIHTTIFSKGVETINHYLETGETHLAQQTAEEYADKLSDHSYKLNMHSKYGARV